jgi:hypothetical protein
MRARLARSRSLHPLLILGIAALIVPTCALADVYVGPAGGATPCNDAGPGTETTPYCKIQTAICQIKATGGTIRVLPGTYHEAIRVTANIQLISTDGPTVTTIDATGKPCPAPDFCTIGAEPNCSAVYFPSAAGTTSRIEGIHVTNNGGGKDQPTFGAKIGAGILVYGSSPTITRNELVGNVISSATFKVFYGAGIYINGTSPLFPPRPVITNNLIQGNIADPPNGTQANPAEADGGGIYVGYNSAPIITGNTIKANRAGDPTKNNSFSFGGGVANYSRVTSQETKISGNFITGNSVADAGGGVEFSSYMPEGLPVEPSRGTLDDNVIHNNIANFGGALDLGDTKAKVYNNTMHGNQARADAGGVYFGVPVNVGDVAEFANNLVTQNAAPAGASGGAFYVDAATNPIVRSNSIWGNTPTNVGGSKTDASYIGLNGNVSSDPLYLNRNGSPPDFRIPSASPAVDAGDNAYVSNPTDVAGVPRIQDGNLDGTATVDMGAHEFAPDFDSDGTPDWQDPDADNDGVPNASDCASLNVAISQPPNAVGGSLKVVKSAGVAVLSWLHAFQAPTYNVYRGTFGGGAPFAYNEVCFDTENIARTVTDAVNPPAGTGFYYIVGSRNLCGESAAVVNGQGQPHSPAPTCATANRNSDGDTPRDLGDNCPLATDGSQGDADADSVGNSCDNCASVANPLQENFDADGQGDACDLDDDNDGVPDVSDCAPLDPSNSLPSAEIQGLSVAIASGTSLAWTSLPAGTIYDVVGGSITALRTVGSISDAACLQDNVASPSWNDPRPDPADGEGYYYLVRGQSSCGPGTYGSATGGAERVPGTPCP